jgi:Fungal Zn(2)-Cys(6) binuclear cluster domain
MEGIDPRLRDTAPQHYEPPSGPSANYSGVTSQSAGYDSLQQSSSSTSARQQSQQHQYYGMPTPGSYSSGPQQEAAGSPYVTQGPPDSSDPVDLKRPRACEACRQLKVRCETDDKSPAGSCRRCAKANRQCVVTAPSRKRQKKTDSRVAELEKKIDALSAMVDAQREVESGNPVLDHAIAQAQIGELARQRGQLCDQQSWHDRSRGSPGRRDTNTLESPIAVKSPPSPKRKYTSEVELYNDVRESSEQQLRRPAMPNPSTCAGLFSGCPPGAREVPDKPYIDVIDRHIVDAQTAYRMFERYNTEMQSLPLVVFGPGTKAEDIRRAKPVLFLAILSAASNTIRPDLQATFLGEIMRLLADRIICRGEKTLEIVQTLQVVTAFYQPPDRYEELNFNQLIHIAVVMGIDIGMGKRGRAGQVAQWREYIGKTGHIDADAAETRRAWLGLYFMCANAAMALRRPLLVRWSAYMEESLQILAEAPDALPSDKWLAHLVQAQHIAEEVGYQFSMDDPPSDVSIIQPKIQYQMKTFEKQLDEWRQNSTKDMPQGSISFLARSPIRSTDTDPFWIGLLKHSEAIIDLYIHEIAMHHSHNIDDFRPPYGVQDDPGEEPDYITPSHIDSLTICLHSIHKAFDAFLGMPLSTIRSLPTLFFVRNSYAAVALIKMYTAVSAKGSKFGSVFKPKDLKVEYYLDALVDIMKRVTEGGQSRVALKFAIILTMLRNWQAKRAAGTLSSKDKGMLSVKSISAGWEKQQRQLGQNPQDPKTASWNTAMASMNANTNVKLPHSGLQMLSEVAMGNNNNASNTPPLGTKNNNNNNDTTTSDPAAAAAAAETLAATINTSTVPWDAQLAAYADMHQSAQQIPQQQQQATSSLPGGDSFSQPYLGGEIDSFAFTAEELGALGNMMDDPSWLNFGLESGAWAM